MKRGVASILWKNEEIIVVSGCHGSPIGLFDKNYESRNMSHASYLKPTEINELVSGLADPRQLCDGFLQPGWEWKASIQVGLGRI